MGRCVYRLSNTTDPEERLEDAVLAKALHDAFREISILTGEDVLPAASDYLRHPGLIATAREIFDAHLEGDNQIGVARDDVRADAAALVAVPAGPRTVAGLRHNVRVGIQYLEAWLGGNGCVPLYDLMEDAATAEISRSQVWQWVHHRAPLDDGEAVTPSRLHAIVDEELRTIEQEVGSERFAAGEFGPARELFERMCTATELEDFLTLAAYEQILSL